LGIFSVTSPLSGEAEKSEKSVFFNYEPSPFFIIGGDVHPLSFSITIPHNGVVAVIPQDVLGNLYYNTFREKVAPVFTKSIKNLLNLRNHLSLQLDLECGNISEEDFDKEEPKYLTEIETIPPAKLQEEVKVLFGFTHYPFDSEDISEILNCSIDDAEKMINQYINGA